MNGTDQRGHACPTDTYCCFCSDGSDATIPCNATVGRVNVREAHRGHTWPGGGCHSSSGPADYFRSGAREKLTLREPGYWYSTLAEQAGLTWRVLSVDKIISRDCHTATFGRLVLSHGHPACLEACPASQRVNTSSPCWVDCFYRAALGPLADRPRGVTPTSGMDIAQLVAAWEKPFATEEEGGCAPLPEWREGAPAALDGRSSPRADGRRRDVHLS